MLRDALLGAGLVALLVLEWVAQQSFGPPWWAAALWAVLLCVTVAVSRRRPLFALMVCGGLNLLVVLNQLVASGAFPFAYSVAPFVLSYRAGRRMARVRPALVAFGGFTTTALVVAVALGLTGTAGVDLPETLLTWFSLLVVLLVAVVVPWLAGRDGMKLAAFPASAKRHRPSPTSSGSGRGDPVGSRSGRSLRR